MHFKAKLPMLNYMYLHKKHNFFNKYIEYKYVLSEYSLLLFVCTFYCIVPSPYLLNTLQKETLSNSICNFFYVCLVNTKYSTIQFIIVLFAIFKLDQNQASSRWILIVYCQVLLFICQFQIRSNSCIALLLYWKRRRLVEFC